LKILEEGFGIVNGEPKWFYHFLKGQKRR